MLWVEEIYLNEMRRPVGVEGGVHFTWKLRSDRQNVIQRAYRIRITGAGIVYDSGKMTDRESVQRPVPDFQMKSLCIYAAQVKVWDNHGEESAWSAPFRFVSACDKKVCWRSFWISAETEEDGGGSAGTYLRKSFEIRKPIREAWLMASAQGIYHAYLNGAHVGQNEMAPGWTDYRFRFLYQTYEVTALLEQGENVIGAQLGTGWYKGRIGFEQRRNVYGRRTAFVGSLLIRYADGSEEWIRTDASWEGSPGPVKMTEIFDGETYDARLEQPGWNRSGFCGTGWKPVSAWPADAAFLRSQPDGMVREMETMPVKRMFQTPKGETVLDFGQNFSGWVCVRVFGTAGECVRLRCFETLDASGNVYTDNLRSAGQTLTYICRGGGGEACGEFYRPLFSIQGFRYVHVCRYPGEIRPENFTACAVYSEMEQIGSFCCSNPDLNQLQSNIEWGLKSNFVDIPTDCPQRDERRGWTGDAQVFCRTAAFIMDTAVFFRKWLRDLAAGQTKDGGVPHVIPDILAERPLDKGGHKAASGWADAAVIVPWTMYLCYGDKEILRQQYGSMQAWVRFMTEHAEDGIWRYENQYGDWLALDAEENQFRGATPAELICAAFYAYDVCILAKTAEALGKTEDAAYYRTLHRELKAAYHRNFIGNDGRVKAGTQTAQVLTLYFGLAGEEERAGIAEDLCRLIRENGGHLRTGFLGTPYICHALSQNGHADEAYALLLKEDFPSWLYQVRRGATTIWEHWDGIRQDGSMWDPGMNSFNHYAYGAVGDWLYRAAAGIDTDEMEGGYRRVVIRPHIGGGLQWMRAALNSRYGKIRSEWSVCGEETELTVEIPPNTRAVICLEGQNVLLETSGLSFVRSGGMRSRAGDSGCRTAYGRELQAETGSGIYKIRFRRGCTQ